MAAAPIWSWSTWRATTSPRKCSSAASSRCPKLSTTCCRPARRSPRLTSAGIVHRDLKPANSLSSRRPDGRGSRRCRLRHLEIGGPGSTSDPSLTSTSTIMGSPLYMSPEQMRSARDVDARTDIWSIGTMLFEAMTGNPPFSGDSVPQICAALLNDPPPHEQDFRPDIPAELEKVICAASPRIAKIDGHRWAIFANALVPYAPPESRLHATRANRGQSHRRTRRDPRMPVGSMQAEPERLAKSTPSIHRIPRPPSLANAGQLRGPHSAATQNSWERPDRANDRRAESSGSRSGGALLGAAGSASQLIARAIPTQVAVTPVSVLSAPRRDFRGAHTRRRDRSPRGPAPSAARNAVGTASTPPLG